MFVNALALAVAAATTDTILTINVESAGIMAVEVKNSGAAALDAFEVWGKVTPDGQSFALATLAAHYTGPTYPITRASASPVTLGAGASAWFLMDVSAFSSIELKASGNAAVTAVDIHASVKNVR